MNKSKTVKLSTNRLELVAATLDHICAELEAPERLASLLNAQVEPGWPPGEYDRNAQEFFRDRLKEGGVAVIGWYSWYAVRRGSPYQPSVLVGAGGYFGPPNEEGEVEIGFSVMSVWQGLGYAIEMAEALIENAFTDIRVKKVIAHTTPVNLASCKVLEKCRFRYVCRDEESGNNLFEILRNTSA
jgi:RimJ/RimL family protein N-acetyltransferase